MTPPHLINQIWLTEHIGYGMFAAIAFLQKAKGSSLEILLESRWLLPVQHLDLASGTIESKKSLVCAAVESCHAFAVETFSHQSVRKVEFPPTVSHRARLSALR
ncbi:MAG: hypothetical protein NXI32_16000 [bacterium]|nr:hypothetical protein [bacterium]